MTRGGVHPGPGRTRGGARGGALAIMLAPERKIINFEQHHKIMICMICMFMNIIPHSVITVYIEVLFLKSFLYAVISNTVDGWKWLEMSSVLSQREMTVRFHESG